VEILSSSTVDSSSKQDITETSIQAVKPRRKRGPRTGMPKIVKKILELTPRDELFHTHCEIAKIIDVDPAAVHKAFGIIYNVVSFPFIIEFSYGPRNRLLIRISGKKKTEYQKIATDLIVRGVQMLKEVTEG
jgi:hypothetical protein